MNGELIRIINYDKPRRPRRPDLAEVWGRARTKFARLFLSGKAARRPAGLEPRQP